MKGLLLLHQWQQLCRRLRFNKTKSDSLEIGPMNNLATLLLTLWLLRSGVCYSVYKIVFSVYKIAGEHSYAAYHETAKGIIQHVSDNWGQYHPQPAMIR